MKRYDENKIREFLLRENLIWNNPLTAWTMLGPIAMPGFLYNAYQIARNRCQTSGKDKAIALFFDEPLTEWQSIILGVKGAVVRFFTERDVRVNYKHNARSDDLKAALQDQAYQNIVVIGHGGRNQWYARDGAVYTEDLDQWMNGLPKKKGYFIQFTCGDEEGRPLGYSVVEDQRKILGYTRSVNLGERFESLWGESLKGIEGLVNISED